MSVERQKGIQGLFSRACKLSLNRVQAWLNMPTTSGSKTGKTSSKKELKPTSASREMLIQKLAAEMAVLKATNDALENQNNEILGICSKILKFSIKNSIVVVLFDFMAYFIEYYK